MSNVVMGFYRLRNLSLAALAGCVWLSLTGCSSLESGSKAPMVQFPAGNWVSHSVKYPKGKIEMTLIAEDQVIPSRTAVLVSNRRLGHQFQGSTIMTTRFRLSSNDGGSTVYDGWYQLANGRFLREPKGKKDHYAGLVFEVTEDRLVITYSDSKKLSAYNGNSLEPLQENRFFTAIRCADVACLRAMPNLSDLVNSDRNPLGRTALYEAAKNGNDEVVALLLDAGANVDLKNDTRRERTPLAAAIRKSQLSTMSLLLEAGANPNQQDAGKESPLHIAAEGCGSYGEMVRILLEAGADPSITNKRGDTPQARLERTKNSTFLPILKRELNRYSKEVSRK